MPLVFFAIVSGRTGGFLKFFWKVVVFLNPDLKYGVFLQFYQIGDKIFMKRTLNFFRLLLGGPSRVPVKYKVRNNFFTWIHRWNQKVHAYFIDLDSKPSPCLFTNNIHSYTKICEKIPTKQSSCKNWKGIIYSYTKICENSNEDPNKKYKRSEHIHTTGSIQEQRKQAGSNIKTRNSDLVHAAMCWKLLIYGRRHRHRNRGHWEGQRERETIVFFIWEHDKRNDDSSYIWHWRSWQVNLGKNCLQ
jgi:hypothetical protein